MGKQILITGTNSYVGTSFKQYIEKKNGNMPLEDRWHVTCFCEKFRMEENGFFKI